MSNTVLKIKGLILTIGVLILSSNSVFSQSEQPVSWDIVVMGNASGGYELNFVANIEEGWHLYSINPTNDPDDIGPLPTEIVYQENEKIRILNDVVEHGELITKYEESFAMELNFYEGEVTFKQKIGVRRGVSTTLNGEISYMVCDDQKCIFPDPQKIEIEINNN